MVEKKKVEEVLAKVRPSIQADGGDVELVEISVDNVVGVKLTGACNGCPMATLTLKAGIERVMKEEIPEVKEVIQV
ncbi:MAG: NifU family protein [Candidatus Cloacimonadota bacterium]|nr:NifU family protein [Candidatus Cloacimonadota bacterium]